MKRNKASILVGINPYKALRRIDLFECFDWRKFGGPLPLIGTEIEDKTLISNIEELDFSPLIIRRDGIPLVAFSHIDGGFLFIKWCAMDRKRGVNRFLIFDAEEKEFINFVDNKLSLRRVINKSNAIYIIDILNYDDFKIRYMAKVCSYETPTEYLPIYDAMFKDM